MLRNESFLLLVSSQERRKLATMLRSQHTMLQCLTVRLAGLETVQDFRLHLCLKDVFNIHPPSDTDAKPRMRVVVYYVQVH